MTRIGAYRRDPARGSGGLGASRGAGGHRRGAPVVDSGAVVTPGARLVRGSPILSIGLGSIAALGLLVSVARAEPPPSSSLPAVPAVLRDVVAVDGIQVPLPAGEWTLASRVPLAAEATSLLLLRRAGETVDAGVLIQAAQPGASTAWGTAPGCERHDLVFTHIRYHSDHDGSCAYVARVDDAATTTAADPAWLDARQGIVRHGWTMPSRWGVAVVRVTSPRTAVQVRYFFPLGRDAAGWTALPGWTQEIWDQVERGTHNQLPPGTGLPDFAPEQPPAPATPEAAAPERDPTTDQVQILAVRVAVATATFASYLAFVGSAWTAAGLTAFAIGMPSLTAGSQDWAESWLGVAPPQPLDLIGIGAELGAPG